MPSWPPPNVWSPAAGRRGCWSTPRRPTYPGPAETLPVADWQRVMTVNLTAPFLLSRAVFPPIRAPGGATLVNVPSVPGRRGWAGAPAYCASKFGLTGLTQALAAEGAPNSIRVVCLYPGAMATHWAPGTRPTGTSPGETP